MGFAALFSFSQYDFAAINLNGILIEECRSLHYLYMKYDTLYAVIVADRKSCCFHQKGKGGC